MGIRDIDRSYALDSPWRPPDPNDVGALSVEFQRDWERRHAADGTHDHDPLIPLAAAIWEDGTGVVAASPGVLSLVAGGVGGQYVLTLDFNMASVDVGGGASVPGWFVHVWPRDNPSFPLFVFENGIVAKNATSVEFWIVDRGGTLTPSSFWVGAYGVRGA